MIVVACGCLTACSTIKYEHHFTDGTIDKVSVSRAWWATDSYEAELPGGAKLKATKSGSNGSPINEVTELMKALPKP